MYIHIKRILDVILSLLGFTLLIPFAILVKVSFLCLGDTGPIFFKQRRVGKDGKLFMIYKFRSMVRDADEVLLHLLSEERYRAEWEENQKIDDDPRITPIGRFLRKSSLDELPQIVNVLKGEMSLIGPRPLVEGELEAHGGSHIYWQVLPGLTGWWACHGRSNIDYDQRLEMEYYYVRNCSLKLDAICFFKTIASVLRKKGAK